MKISVSVGEFPLNVSLNKVLFRASDIVDGVELFWGLRPVFFKGVYKLLKENKLRVLSIHQPVWSMFGLFKDESFYQKAQKFNAQIVLHPPLNAELNSNKAKDYFTYHSRMSKKYKVQVSVENMPKTVRVAGKLIHYHKQFQDPVVLVDKVCSKYEFGLVLDTTHLRLAGRLGRLNESIIMPFLTNIHLSDFRGKKDHLALGKGDLDLKEFTEMLRDNNYHGLVTLELSAHFFYFGDYAGDIRDSVLQVRKLLKR